MLPTSRHRKRPCARDAGPVSRVMQRGGMRGSYAGALPASLEDAGSPRRSTCLRQPRTGPTWRGTRWATAVGGGDLLRGHGCARIDPRRWAARPWSASTPRRPILTVPSRACPERSQSIPLRVSPRATPALAGTQPEHRREGSSRYAPRRPIPMLRAAGQLHGALSTAL